MERFSFGADVAYSLVENLLDGVTVAPLTPPIAAGAKVQAAIFRIAPNGRIARHPTVAPQIIAVLEGVGEVSGNDGAFESITRGEAVYFDRGEEHETKTSHGLVALILEAPNLQPFRTKNQNG